MYKKCNSQHNKEQDNKWKEIRILCDYCSYTFDIWYLFDISTKKTQIRIKITFENNAFTRQRTLKIPAHNPFKTFYQFHHRNQFNILNVSCIPIICFLKHFRLTWGSRKQALDKTESIKLSISEPPHYMSYYTKPSQFT